MSNLAARRAAVVARLRAACLLAHRDPRSVRLIAVSKGQQASTLIEYLALQYDAPPSSSEQTCFGENYADEMLAKAEALVAYRSKIRWCYIGQLQSNKIGRIVAAADEIHALASLRHAEMIARHALAFGKAPFPVYLCVNAGNEDTKGGVAFPELDNLAEQVGNLPELSVQGVMAIPPPLTCLKQESEDTPPIYLQLRAAADRIGQRRLSLGMSDDLEMAIRAGSTDVRIGRALLGERVHPSHAHD